MQPRHGPRSADRLIDLLDCLGRDRSPKSLAELSAALGAPKASLFSLFRTLVDREILSRDQTGRYQLGPAAIRIAVNIAARRSFSEITHPVLVKLARAAGETALIACLDAQHLKLVYVDKAEGDSPIRYTVPVGMVRDLHCSSGGKVVLAFRPDVRKVLIRRNKFERLTANTITKGSALLAELERVRKDGVATAFDESTLGASGLSAPILKSTGELIAVVVVAGPTERFRSRLALIEAEVRRAAQVLSEALPDLADGILEQAVEHRARIRA